MTLSPVFLTAWGTFSAWGFAFAASPAAFVLEAVEAPLPLFVEFLLRVVRELLLVELLLVPDLPFLLVDLLPDERVRLPRVLEERVA